MSEVKGYYVTLIAAKRTAWLAGPYHTHDEALAMVDRAWAVACDLDPRCSFAARGTSSITRSGAAFEDLPAGRINHLLAA